MGKGFQNFMSKKDFHPSAWWNLKKVWEARQKKEQQETRDAEMQVQYEKEQEIFNNKALLGDEKAKMGLSFMYEAPAGINKREEEKPEPKFEWQRKYNAPRESWAQNNEAIVDHPFGIAVRNVRCVRCHNWGHVNTDSECPLYGKSGNYEEEGYANNPSDLVKELRKAEKEGKAINKNEYRGRKKKVEEGEDEEWVPADSGTLAEQMREEHGMKLKANMLSQVKEFEQLEQMGNVVKEKQDETKNMLDFFNSMSAKDKERVMRKTLGLKEEKGNKKKSKKDKKKKKKEEKKMKKKLKKMKVKKEEPESDEEIVKEKNGRSRRHSSVSPPPKRSRRDSDAVEKRKIKEEPVSSDEERNGQRRKNGSPSRKRRVSKSPVRSPARSQVRRRRDSRSTPKSPIRRRDSPIREKRREERGGSRERKRSPIRRRRDSRSPLRRERSRSPIGKRRETKRRDSRTPERKRSPVRRRDSRTPEKKEKTNLVADKKIKEEPISEDEYERREEEKKKEGAMKENGGRRSRSKSNDSSSSSSSSSSSDSDSDSSGEEKKNEKKADVAHEYRGKFAKAVEIRKSPEKEKRSNQRRNSSGSPPRRRRSPSPRRRSRSPRRR